VTPNRSKPGAVTGGKYRQVHRNQNRRRPERGGAQFGHYSDFSSVSPTRQRIRISLDILRTPYELTIGQ
jgi:hypothetical protein